MIVSKDQTLGAVILVVSIIGIVAYGVLMWYFPNQVLEITAFLAVAGVLAILAWIGYTLATTPPPQPIEEIEKELQAEAKKAEGQASSPQGTPSDKPATK
jgi:predicted DNA-binding transcriptional regulator